MNKSILIAQVTPSKGNGWTDPKTGAHHTFFDITDSDQIKYSIADWAIVPNLKVGDKVYIEYVSEKKGNFTNNKIRAMSLLEKVKVAAEEKREPSKEIGMAYLKAIAHKLNVTQQDLEQFI